MGEVFLGAHSPRDDGGVRDHPAPGGKDPVGGVETAHVLRRGLVPNQDDVVAALREDLRLLGVEGDFARGGAGRGRDAGGDEPAVLARLLLLFGVEGGLEQLVQALGVTVLEHRLPRRDDALLDHVGDDLERGPAGASAQSTGLQDIELAALDGELHVLRVPEVALQGLLGGVELPVGPLQLRVVLHLLDGLPGPDAGHHVLALRVGQVLARDGVLACQGAAGEADAGGAVLTPVAEDHGDNAHRRDGSLRNLVHPPEEDGTLGVAGLEYRLDSRQ